MAATIGIAIKPYRKKMEPKDIPIVFFLDCPIFIGRDSPIKMKLRMLKIVPRISPLPMGFKPNRKNETPTNIARVIAKEQYFFWVCLICSILTVFVFENFHDLAVDNHCSADDTKDDKNGCK